jgi:hypothetical protein
MLLVQMCSGASKGVFPSLFVYEATDYSLTQASEYYTLLAYNHNQNVLSIPADWRNRLDYFGVNTQSYAKDPTVYVYGVDGVMSAGYDFDRAKLWAYLTAYSKSCRH